VILRFAVLVEHRLVADTDRDRQTDRRTLAHRAVKTNLDFTEARDSGSGISWAICKSAPCSRQTTSPTPHHSVFLQTGCPSCRKTNSIKALKAKQMFKYRKIKQKIILTALFVFTQIVFYSIYNQFLRY